VRRIDHAHAAGPELALDLEASSAERALARAFRWNVHG
jgi:hypothetical protein